MAQNGSSLSGQFAVLPLERNAFLVVASINIHNIYLDTQLRTINTDINIVKIDKGKDIG